MGVFDSVMVPCPKCGQREEFQSKSGPCALAVYNLEDAPDSVLMNINRHAPIACGKCGAVFEVELGGEPPRRTMTARSVQVEAEQPTPDARKERL